MTLVSRSHCGCPELVSNRSLRRPASQVVLPHAGHDDPRAPNRKSASTVILALRSSWSWIAFRGAAIFLLFVLAALRDHDPCHETLR